MEKSKAENIFINNKGGTLISTIIAIITLSIFLSSFIYFTTYLNDYFLITQNKLIINSLAYNKWIEIIAKPYDLIISEPR